MLLLKEVTPLWQGCLDPQLVFLVEGEEEEVWR